MRQQVEPPGEAPHASGRLAVLKNEPGTWALAWPVGLFTIITFFVGADMAADLADGVPFVHMAIESVAIVLCLAGVAGTGIQLGGALRRARDLQRDLEGTRADLVRSREQARELLGGLGGVIDLQFQRWSLTAAQCEVALLVLKGFSYKEIADLRETTERTVRNQALAIYRKGGLANRAEMAAFFLEDLLSPRQKVGGGHVRVVDARAVDAPAEDEDDDAQAVP